MININKMFSKLHTFSNKKIIIIWLISYMTVFLIPIIFNFFVSAKSVNILFSQSESLAEEIVLRKQDDFNMLWSDCNTIFQTVYFNDAVQEISSKDSADQVSQLTAHALKKDLASLFIDNSMIQDIQLIFENVGMVVSRNRFEPIISFYEIDELFDMSVIQNGLFDNEYTGELKKTNTGFAYLKTLKFIGRMDKHVTLLVSISPVAMEQNNPQKLDNRGGTFFLFSQSGELIYSDGQTNDALVQAIIDIPPGSRELKLGKESYLVYEYNYYNINHIYALPYSIIAKEVHLLNLFVIITNVIVLFIGMCSIRFFLKQNMRPMNEIMQMIDNKSTDLNEYKVIMHNLKTQKDEVREIRNSLNIFKPLVMQNTIEQMISSGRVDSRTVQNLHLCLDEKMFYLILIDITNMGDLEVLENEESLEDAFQLSFTALSNIFSEILSLLGHIYSGMIDDNIVIIVNTAEENHDTMMEALEKAYQLTQQYLKISARIVSAFGVDNLEKLPKLYTYSLDCLEYIKIINEEGVFSRFPSEPPEYNLLNERKEQFVNQVLCGDSEGALKNVNSILEENILSTKYIAKYNVVDMLMSVVNYLAQKDASLFKEMVKYDEIIKSIMDTQKISDIKDKLADFITELCGIVGQFQGNEEGVEDQVAEYVRNNYFESEINAKIIASKFKMTPAYLSGKFKQKYGMSILEFINHVRIDNIKRLLVTTDQSIDTICQQCGYISNATFLRQFKKMTGMTPAAYRNVKKMSFKNKNYEE